MGEETNPFPGHTLGKLSSSAALVSLSSFKVWFEGNIASLQ